MSNEWRDLLSRFFKPLYWPNGSRAHSTSDDKISMVLMFLGWGLAISWWLYQTQLEISLYLIWLVGILAPAIPMVLARLRMCAVLARAEDLEQENAYYPQTPISQFAHRILQDSEEYNRKAEELLVQAQQSEDGGAKMMARWLRRRAAKKQEFAEEQRILAEKFETKPVETS